MRTLRTLAYTVALVFCFCSTPNGLQAETITVRSGEHDGFTRIVLDLPRPRGWTLEQREGSAQLALRGPKARFDLSNAFRKIDTGRVNGLRAAEETNTLAIGLNCDCTIDVFRLGQSMLVIDVKGEAAVTAAPSRPPLSTAKAAAENTFVSMTNQAAVDRIFPFDLSQQNRRAPLGFGAFPGRAEMPEPHDLGKSSDTEATKPDTIATFQKSEREKRISETERRLAEQVSRAVSQGLITPRAARLPDLKPETPARSELISDNRPQPASEEKPETPGLNLRAETSADRDLLEALGALTMTKNGETCLSAAQLDISAWSGNGTFSQQIGAHRSALVGEFDRPNTDAARKLAQLYIHYGFGAEALHVLKSTGLSDQDQTLLQSMGEIMEYGHARSPEAFADQFDCDTPVALWAILAHETIPGTAEINAEALLRAVNSLPPHLRNLLGTIASDRLRSVLRHELSGRVLRLVERGMQTPDARFDMAQAGQHLAEGDVPAASDALENVVEANTDLSPKALIKLIDSRLSANLPLDVQTTDLAGAYAREYRKQPLGIELKRVHILALSEVGAFDDAFAELLHFSDRATPEMIAQIRNRAMSALARSGSDQAFLKHALEIEDQALSTLGIASANAVASRLIALGFSPRAEIYLRPGADGDLGAARRLLRARAALAQMKPRRAEADLLGLSGAEADMLRAQARSMGGDHQAAQRLFAKLDKPDRMLEEAWLSGDWDTLRSSGDTLWLEVAEMAMEPDAETATREAETGTLARNRLLLAESSTTRETIAALLSRYTLENALPSKE